MLNGNFSFLKALNGLIVILVRGSEACDVAKRIDWNDCVLFRQAWLGKRRGKSILIGQLYQSNVISRKFMCALKIQTKNSFSSLVVKKGDILTNEVPEYSM